MSSKNEDGEVQINKHGGISLQASCRHPVGVLWHPVGILWQWQVLSPARPWNGSLPLVQSQQDLGLHEACLYNNVHIFISLLWGMFFLLWLVTP